MKHLLIAACVILLSAGAAHAQTQPITIQPQEYEAMIRHLIAQNPVLSLLVEKQNQAQKPPPLPTGSNLVPPLKGQ